MDKLVVVSWTKFVLIINMRLFISFSPATKFDPLSDVRDFGISLLCVNRQKAFINEFVSRSFAISRCTTLVAIQVNRPISFN